MRQNKYGQGTKQQFNMSVLLLWNNLEPTVIIFCDFYFTRWLHPIIPYNSPTSFKTTDGIVQARVWTLDKNTNAKEMRVFIILMFTMAFFGKTHGSLGILWVKPFLTLCPYHCILSSAIITPHNGKANLSLCQPPILRAEDIKWRHTWSDTNLAGQK